MFYSPLLGRSWRSILEDAKSKICSVDRVLCGILLSLRVVEAPGLGTLGVTKDGRLVVDPKAVVEVTLEGRRLGELVRMLMHEALHVLFLHPERCEKLPDRNICNIAADAIVEYTIDETVMRHGNEGLARLLGMMAGGVVQAPSPGSEYARGLDVLRTLLKSCGVEWDSIPDYTLEELYKKLTGCLSGGGRGGYRGIDRHPWGGGGIQPQEAGAGSGGGSGGEVGMDKLEQIARMAAKLARESQSGNAIASKLPGTVPGEWEALLEAIGVIVRLDWRQTLQRLLDRLVPSDYTWRRPSRRSQALGVTLPGMLKRAWKLAIILDTSGSIEDEEYREFMGAVYTLLLDKPVETVVVVEADVKVQKMSVYTDPPPPSVVKWLARRRGFGGTNFAIPVREVLEKHPDLDLIIYFTDGYGEYPASQPAVPIVWVISKHGVKPCSPFWPPFGYVILMRDGSVHIGGQCGEKDSGIGSEDGWEESLGESPGP